MKVFGIALGCALGFTASLASVVAAEKYPAAMIRIIVPFPAGGTTDILARHVAQALGDKLKVNTIVENRPGASGIVGSEAVAKAAPDGGTLLVAATHHVINPTLYRKLPYDTRKDFAPVALLATVPNALVVHPGVPAKTVADLIALAKKDPGKLSFGSTGVGGANHLAGEMFKLATGTDILHVPYRGAAPAMNDLLGGHIPMMFDSLPTVLPVASNGDLRVLGVTSLARAKSLPDVPTLDEAGVKGFEAMAWFGMYMSAGSAPGEPRQQLVAAVQEILASDAIKDAFSKLGVEPGTLFGDKFGGYVESEINKWGGVVKSAQVPLQ
ncbi:Bug family tripartite tricarboxylate transporter substrate binding protein [Enterovirga sp. CN4-39]|uniref:Bug family tripartite tricarboxylate transporter substrate binding protein n=1 Tax=Enterovirga sp. CN4-39 TaxID=3400910 RepID=UPI003C0696DC